MLLEGESSQLPQTVWVGSSATFSPATCGIERAGLWACCLQLVMASQSSSPLKLSSHEEVAPPPARLEQSMETVSTFLQACCGCMSQAAKPCQLSETAAVNSSDACCVCFEPGSYPQPHP